MQRQMNFESLEGRRLMAADLGVVSVEPLVGPVVETAQVGDYAPQPTERVPIDSSALVSNYDEGAREGGLGNDIVQVNGVNGAGSDWGESHDDDVDAFFSNGEGSSEGGEGNENRQMMTANLEIGEPVQTDHYEEPSFYYTKIDPLGDDGLSGGVDGVLSDGDDEDEPFVDLAPLPEGDVEAVSDSDEVGLVAGDLEDGSEVAAGNTNTGYFSAGRIDD